MTLTAFAPNSDVAAVYRGYTGTGTLMLLLGLFPLTHKKFHDSLQYILHGALNTVT